MKILFVNPGGRSQGGAERSLALLIEGLTDRGHDVHVALMAAGDASTVFRDAGASIAGIVADELQVAARHAGPIEFAAGALRAVPKVANVARHLDRIARRVSPDLIHSNGFRSHILTPLLARRAPVVWSLRDRAPHRFHRVLLAGAARSATAIVANSSFTADQLSHDSTHVVGNPISPAHQVAKEAARSWLGLPHDRHVVAMLAHLHPSKGHDVAIASLERWNAEARPVLVIAGGRHYNGSDAYASELDELIADKALGDDVRLLGDVDDVATLYAAADVVVHPCRHPEGFGRVVVEAQAAGVPVVATRLGGVIGLIRDGETGRLVAPGDAGVLANAIDDVLWPGPLRDRIIGRGRTAAERFSPAAHTDAMEQIYRVILGLETPCSNQDVVPSVETLVDEPVVDKPAENRRVGEPEASPSG